jgi:hypothetical protein
LVYGKPLAWWKSVISTDRYFYRLPASSPAIFFDFDMSKKSKITKSVLHGSLFRWVGHAASSRLPVSEVKIFAQEAPLLKYV